MFRDREFKLLTVGSIIDLHQTVNGENIFVILSLEKLDLRYRFDLNRKYEYDVRALLSRDPIMDITEWEIIGNIFK